MFKVTAILQVLFAFTIFFNPVSTASIRPFGNGLARRADEAAGIGVELELGDFTIEAKEKLTSEQLEKIKGAEMIPVGLDGEKTNWKLTAEIPRSKSAGTIFPEVIVDGVENKVGAPPGDQTKHIGEEIFNFLKDWAPHRPDEVTIPGFDELGPFKVKWPKDPKDPETVKFSPQVTTAMPLAAVLQILRDTKERDGGSNPLASKGSQYRKDFRILARKDFASFQKIKESDITDEFLGYFSLLATYCVLANKGNPNEGPKHLVSIMPRTDFSAQYNKFIEPKLKDQLTEKSLYDIVKTVSNSKNELAQEEFKWATDTRTEIDDDWDGKAGDLESGKLQVGKFLNYLQGRDPAAGKTLPQKDLVRLMDKALRHGQVGGYGDKMEKMLDTEKSVPIFELRDLEPIYGSPVIDLMGSYEDKVIEYHHQFAQEESVEDKPPKGMSLSIVLEATTHGSFPSHLESKWEFYAVKTGESIGKCGEPEGEIIVADPNRDKPAGWEKADPHNPPWPAGIFPLNIWGEPCEYKCDGTGPGKLFCPKKEITCVEDPMKSKKEDGTMECTSYRFLHKVVYCDF